MKNSRNGKTKKAPKIGLWLVGAVLLSHWHSPKAVAVARELWVYDQISLSPAPNFSRQVGYQLGFSVLTMGDTASSQALVSWDAREFELTAKAATRIFAQVTDTGKEERAHFRGSESNFGIEIARRFLSLDGRHGRLGVEYSQFIPGNSRWIRFGVNAGIVEKADVPWLSRINIQLFEALSSGQNSYLLASLEAGYLLKGDSVTGFKLGGGLFWSYALRKDLEVSEVSALPGQSARFEHMLFSLGPWGEYSWKNGFVRLYVPIRLWLDRESAIRANPSDPSKSLLFVSYPSEVTSPDLSLYWTLYL